MPLPSPTGWAPQQLLGGVSTTTPSWAPPKPDWATQSYWDQAIKDVEAAMNGGNAVQFGRNAVGPWSTPEQITAALQLRTAQLGDPNAPDFGNGRLANGIVQLGVLGSGIGSALVNTGVLGGAGAAGGGAGGATGLSEITLPSSVAPTGAVAGGLGPSIPAAGGAAAVGPGLGAAGAAGAVGNALSGVPRWLDYAIPGLNALVGGYAANEASDAETAALQAGIEEQRRQFDTTRTDLMPWLTAGQGALGRLQDPTTNFMASPDYEFRRSEGQRDIGNSFAARGGAASGNALRALTEYNSSLASGEFGDWWNRQAGLAGVGQTTGTQLGQLGANSAGNIGNFLAGQGASRASGVLGKYGALAGAGSDIYRNFLYRRAA